jgi:hypothetical protein
MENKCGGMGTHLENMTLYTVQFADDQVVLAGDKEDLEYMTRKLKENYEKWGPDMNLNKTKYRVGHKSLTNICKSQSMRNIWITTICDLIRPRGKSLGGVTLRAAIL